MGSMCVLLRNFIKIETRISGVAGRSATCIAGLRPAAQQAGVRYMSGLSQLRCSLSFVAIHNTSCAHLTKRLHVATVVSRLRRACVPAQRRLKGCVPEADNPVKIN